MILCFYIDTLLNFKFHLPSVCTIPLGNELPYQPMKKSATPRQEKKKEAPVIRRSPPLPSIYIGWSLTPSSSNFPTSLLLMSTFKYHYFAPESIHTPPIQNKHLQNDEQH